MIYYALLFFVSLLATWWIFKKVLSVAIMKNIVDNPDARKIQKTPVPVLGGVAVFFGMVLAIGITGIFYDIHSLFSIICMMVVMLYIGTLDDILSLSPILRLFIEIIVVLIIIFTNGYSINDFHGLWGLNAIPEWVAIIITVFGCVGIINSINLIDGVNGLSSGYCILACSLFGFFAFAFEDRFTTSLAFISIGALIPFFCHNVFGKKSKMFIGDGGTLLMGTIMSSFVINILHCDSKIALSVNENFGLIPFCLAVLAIPVFDTLRVMLARIKRGTSPFHPDKTHLHHLLFELHFSHIGTTGMELIATLAVVLSWFISYLLGASIDVQLYVVILLSICTTFGFYSFAKRQIKKQSRIYHAIIKLGDKTHVGHTPGFEKFRAFLDRGVDDK